MLNKNMKNVLSALSAINTQAIITYPVTGIKMGNNIQAFFNLEKLGETETEEYGIFNIPELLSTIGVIGDDADVSMTEGILNITNDSANIRYQTTNISVIEDECRTKLDMVDRVQSDKNTKVMTFDLPSTELDKLKKVSGVLKDLTELSIKSEKGESDVITLTAQGKEKSSNNIAIKFNGVVEEEVELKIVMSNLAKIPNTSYKVSVYKSSKGSLITLFESVEVDGLKIIISAK